VATNPPVQVGELTDVPAPGSGVKSPFCQEVAARIMGRFATAAARTSAWAASIAPPAKGTPSYLATGDVAEGPEFWNGVAWRKPWNAPWGVVGSALVTADQTGIGTTNVDLTGFAVTFTAVANRLYRVDWLLDGNNASGGAGASHIVRLNDGATGLGIVYITGAMNASESRVASGSRLVTLAAGAHTLKLTGNCNSGYTLTIANSTLNGQFIVSDAGPAAGAPS